MKSQFFAVVVGSILALSFQHGSMLTHSYAQEADTESGTPAKNADKDSTSIWNVDGDHSSVIFAVSHSGLSYIYGRFNSFSGTVTIDAQRPESSVFTFDIEAKSIDTNNEQRDQKLRSSEFLDVAQYKSISFESTDVKLKVDPKPEGEPKRTFIVGGNLTIHGETRRVVLPIELLAAGKGKDGQYRCGFMSKFVVKRSSHGIDAMTDLVGDSVAVTFSFQAIQEAESVEEIDQAKEELTLEPAEGRLSDIEAKRKRIQQLFR